MSSSKQQLFDDVSSDSSSSDSSEEEVEQTTVDSSGEGALTEVDDNIEVWEVKVPTSLLKDGIDGLGLGSTILLESGLQDRVGGGKVKITHKPCTGPKFMLTSKPRGGKGMRSRKVDKTVTFSIPPNVDLSKGVAGIVKGGYGQVEQDKTLKRRWKAIGDVSETVGTVGAGKRVAEVVAAAAAAKKKAKEAAPSSSTSPKTKSSKKRKMDGGDKSAKKSKKKKKKSRKE